jgi:YbbR domain-containing protein
MDNWFQSKWFVRGISLVFAIILYIFVSTSVNPNEQDSTLPSQSSSLHTLDDVPVEVRIDDEQYVVSGIPEAVTVSLEGAPGIVTPTVIQRNFTVYVDLVDLQPGNHTVELQYDNIPEGLNIYIEPKTIDVTIEERATGVFPVTAEILNREDMAAGHEIVQYSISHEQVEITSSQNVIDQIGMVKVYINVAEADESILNREVPVNVYDLQGNELNVRVEPENIEVSVEINNPSKEVPVEVPITGDIPSGYAVSILDVSLDEVEIFATSEVLESLYEIPTEEIDVSDIEGSETFEVGLDLPEDVYAPDVENVEVEVTVEPSETFHSIPIEVEGLDEDQGVSWNEPTNGNIDVTVVGNEDDLGELAETDIEAYIDVGNLDSGEHVVPLQFNLPNADDFEVASEHRGQYVIIEIE